MIKIDEEVFAYDDVEWTSNESFVVIGAPESLLVEALTRAGGRFLCTDEAGVEHSDMSAAVDQGLYTPNYVAEPIVTERGVEGYVDCKSAIAEPLAAAMKRILHDELERAGALDAHVQVLE